jgi:hypothetical protein
MHSAGCLAHCQGLQGEDCRRSRRAHCQQQQGACRPCLLALCLLLWVLLLVWVLTAAAAGTAGVVVHLLEQAPSLFLLQQQQQQGLGLSLLLQSVRLTRPAMQQVRLQQQQRVSLVSRRAAQRVSVVAPGFTQPLQAASTAPLSCTHLSAPAAQQHSCRLPFSSSSSSSGHRRRLGWQQWLVWTASQQQLLLAVALGPTAVWQVEGVALAAAAGAAVLQCSTWGLWIQHHPTPPT